MKNNNVLFSPSIFQYIDINGAVVFFLVQEFPNLSNCVKPLLGQMVISVVDVGAREEDASFKMLSSPTNEGAMTGLVDEQ